MDNWDKFITENRAVIDEFLGSNNPTYTAIALKGSISLNLGRERAFDYFKTLMDSGLTQIEQNNYLRKLLKELRDNLHQLSNLITADTQMRFGINSKLLLGKDKEIFNKIIGGELV